MELVEKGRAAELGDRDRFVATLQWSTAADFDLAAGYETTAGKQGLIYYGNQGDLKCFPFMELSSDDGVGEKTGPHVEQIRVAKIEGMKHIWFFCWDYSQIQTGSPARFSESDVRIAISGDDGETHDIKFDAGDDGNVCLIATIDNSDPASPRIANTSKAGTLKGLRNLSQLLAIVRK